METTRSMVIMFTVTSFTDSLEKKMLVLLLRTKLSNTLDLLGSDIEHTLQFRRVYRKLMAHSPGWNIESVEEEA